MKFVSTLFINAKKLRYRMDKALFLVIPITILVALAFIISSQVRNFQQATDQSVFGEIEEQNTVLELEYPREDFQGGPGRGGFDPSVETEYSEADVQVVEGIDHVSFAALNYILPISRMVSSDLFDEIDVEFRSLSALNESSAELYTSEDFSYKAHESVPIVLNASQFTETYEDWNGETEFSVDFRSMRESGGDPSQLSPVKSRAISYNTDDLIGKEFTITFGGYGDVQGYTLERDNGVMTFVKLTEKEIVSLEEDRASVISEYWNYDSLRDGLTYTFRVVGVIESATNTSMYIPVDFATSLVDDYIEYQVNAQNGTEIPADVLGTIFTGLTYDGLELLQSSGSFRGPGGGGMGLPPGSSLSDSSTYEIPGLVYEVDENDSSEILGIHNEVGFYANTLKKGKVITVKVDSIYNRSNVIEVLNDSGYAYQDVNNLDVFGTVQSTLEKISRWLVVSFVILTVLVIMLTMSKFVSESTKEIGIFRAIGFTKKNILSIFLVQSLLYTFVGYVLGVIFGFLGNIIAASFIADWFEGFISETVEESFSVVTVVDSSVFSHIDGRSIITLSIILLVVSLVVSYIPAYRASNISPVEAIKSE